MKRYILTFSVFIVVFCFTFTAYSFNIDGKNSGVEWENAQSVLLFYDKSGNNSTEFGSLMWELDEDNLYLCFNFMQSDSSEENQNTGVAFSINDSDYYIITAAERVTYDSDKYRVEGALTMDISSGATCEARVGFKHNIPDEINGNVRFIDSDASYSNIYYFEIENEKEEITDYSRGNNTTKTTKHHTTKSAVTTTKVTTSESSTTKPTTEKTTRVKSKTKTTKSSETKKKSDGKKFNPFDLFKNDETTEKTSSERTTKKKTTKLSGNNIVTSVKIIEKEVYITAESEKTVSETEDYSENVQDNTTIYTDITTSQGKKYQMLTAIAAGIALISVAVLGTLGANNKAKKNSDKDKNSSSESENNSGKSSD